MAESERQADEIEMYGYECEHCGGIVHERVVKREAFKHRNGFVILENVPIGVCDKCGTRYYHSSLLRRVAEMVADKATARSEQVPVAQFSRI